MQRISYRDEYSEPLLASFQMRINNQHEHALLLHGCTTQEELPGLVTHTAPGSPRSDEINVSNFGYCNIVSTASTETQTLLHSLTHRGAL